MKNKSIFITALIFIMGACFALPSFAQGYDADMEQIVKKFEKNLDVNIIPDNISAQQLVPFLNVAVNKRDMSVINKILNMGVDLQGSEDLYYQDPLLIALANKCDDETMLDTDKKIMKLLIDNGAGMTKPYLTPYQEYNFGLVSFYLHSPKYPNSVDAIRKDDRYNVITVATGYVAENTDSYYIEKLDYLLKLGAKNSAVNKIDMKAFATVISKYQKKGKELIDVLLNNNMIVKEEHSKIIKNLVIQRQRKIQYKTGINVLPLSSEKIRKRYVEKTYDPVIVAIWTDELKAVEKDEQLIARLEQRRFEQQEEFSKRLEEALTNIRLEKLNEIEQLGKGFNY